MNILLTGIDGYMGWPTALRLSKRFPKDRIIGVDNLARRRWVKETGADTVIPIATMEERLEAAKANGFDNIAFVQGDLVDRKFVNALIKEHRPAVVVHLAAQPSAPYSQIDGEMANYSQFNNNQSTRNLLWGLKENDLLTTHFIETTTMGVYGAPEFEIPEGFIEVEHKGGRDTIPFPGMAGSWYHMSKSNDVNNLLLASKQWKLPITDLRTAILYGASTEETQMDPRLATRFDVDYYFGVVGNRFCAMVLAGYPITLYGKGLQGKPQISLEDTVESIANALERPANGTMKVYNQMTEVVQIQRLANSIAKAAKDQGLEGVVKHIPNPRVEKEDHNMRVNNQEFLKLLGRPHQTLEEGISTVMKELKPYQEKVRSLKDRFI